MVRISSHILSKLCQYADSEIIEVSDDSMQMLIESTYKASSKKTAENINDMNNADIIPLLVEAKAAIDIVKLNTFL